VATRAQSTSQVVIVILFVVSVALFGVFAFLGKGEASESELDDGDA
jgi:hypothetical protein